MIDQIFYLCGGAALGAAAYGIYWASKPDAYVDARITYEDWVNSLPLHDQMKVYRIHKSKLGAARAPFSEFEIQMLTNEYNEMKAAEAMAINYEDYRPSEEAVPYLEGASIVKGYDPTERRQSTPQLRGEGRLFTQPFKSQRLKEVMAIVNSGLVMDVDTDELERLLREEFGSEVFVLGFHNAFAQRAFYNTFVRADPKLEQGTAQWEGPHVKDAHDRAGRPLATIFVPYRFVESAETVDGTAQAIIPDTNRLAPQPRKNAGEFANHLSNRPLSEIIASHVSWAREACQEKSRSGPVYITLETGRDFHFSKADEAFDLLKKHGLQVSRMRDEGMHGGFGGVRILACYDPSNKESSDE